MKAIAQSIWALKFEERPNYEIIEGCLLSLVGDSPQEFDWNRRETPSLSSFNISKVIGNASGAALYPNLYPNPCSGLISPQQPSPSPVTHFKRLFTGLMPTDNGLSPVKEGPPVARRFFPHAIPL
jgi:hypothetical protein